MFGFKIRKETAAEKAESKVTTILDYAVNYRSRKVLKHLNTMDLVDIYERQVGSNEPISNLVQIVIVNELQSRYPRAIQTWLEHTKLHLRSVIENELRMREKEALNHGKPRTEPEEK